MSLPWCCAPQTALPGDRRSAYQERVMTSTAEGEEGASFGYIHRPGVERAEPIPHMSVVGGEERFWLGPEGGNFALYFERGAPIDFAHWQVPEALDWGAWPVTAQGEREVRVERSLELTNYHGTVLALHVTRTVRLLDARAIAQTVGVALPEGVRAVGYESENRLENRGQKARRRETGLVSIWLLGMFRPGPRATVVIPFDSAAQGAVVHDDYFGAIGPDRLRVGARCVFLRADGAQRER